jgi:hypothetical protein
MLLGLLMLALLGMNGPLPWPSPTHRPAGDEHLAQPALAFPHVPTRRRGRQFAWPGLEDDPDEEGGARPGPFLGLLPPFPERPVAVRAPQRTPALAAHPAVTSLVYSLCVLLL